MGIIRYLYRVQSVPMFGLGRIFQRRRGIAIKMTTMVLLGLAMLAGTASGAASGDEVANFVKTLATKNMQGVSGKASPAVAEKRLSEQDSNGSAQEVAASQTKTESDRLQVGQSVIGALHQSSQRFGSDNTLIDWWTLQVQDGREYEIRMESSDFDAYLVIADERGNVLGSDDDNGGGRNAAVRIDASRGGTVRIGANQASTGGGGQYRLSASEIVPVAVPTGGPRDGRYALIVGMADYPGTGNDLPGVESDATALLSMLKDDFGYTDREIFVLRNEQATRKNVVRAVREFLGQAGPEGHALLYYSGHGTQTETNVALVAPIDPEPDDKDEAIVLYDGLLLDDEVGYLLRTLEAGAMTVLFDSCFSGTGARGGFMKFAELADVEPFAATPKSFLTDGWEVPKSIMSGEEGFFGPLELDRRVTFLAASAESEVAWVGGEDLGMSVFTYLITQQSPKNKNMNIQTFIDRFAPSVTRYTESRYSKSQTVNGEWAGKPRKISQLMGGRR